MLLMWGMTSIRATVVSENTPHHVLFSFKSSNRLYVQLETRMCVCVCVTEVYMV